MSRLWPSVSTSLRPPVAHDPTSHDRPARASHLPVPRLARLLCLALLALTGPAMAQSSEPEQAILQWSVNQVDRGEVVVLLRGADVLVRVTDLERAGLRGFVGRREPYVGVMYVSLASLAPAVGYELDERALVLRVTTAPALLSTNVQDFLQARPEGLIYTTDTSAFLNTSLTGIDFERFTWTGEGGLSIRNTLLYGTAFRDEDGIFSRGLTNFTVDDRERLIRYVIGDRFDATGPLGGANLVGGFSVSREFSLDPYLDRKSVV